MKKLIVLFLLSAPIALFFGCSKGSQTYGPAGAQGAAGVQGAVPVAITGKLSLTSGQFSHGTVPLKYALQQYIGSPNISYLLSAYVSSVNAPKIWYKLPAYDVVSTGDELYASLGYDSVKIWYYNASGWPTDSNFTCNIVIIPNPNP
jgi:hypothetical protein